jgi:hypothetical protein
MRQFAVVGHRDGFGVVAGGEAPVAVVFLRMHAGCAGNDVSVAARKHHDVALRQPHRRLAVGGGPAVAPGEQVVGQHVLGTRNQGTRQVGQLAGHQLLREAP